MRATTKSDAQQRLLGDDIGGGYPAQGHARRAGMRADKQLLEGRSLGRRLQAEALADVRPVFIVIGDFQPFAFFIAPCCSAMPEQRSTSASLALARFQHVVRVNQYRVALPAAAGGDVVFRVALRAVFKAERKSHCSRWPSSSSNQP
jgi:hypothetical protein